MTPQLDDAAVARFRRDGFLPVAGLATDAELAELFALFTDLFAARAGRDDGEHFDMAGRDDDEVEPRLPQILNPGRHWPALVAHPLRVRAQRVAEQLLGGPVRLDFDHAILKPARSGAATAWHQDEAFWDPAHDYQALSLWVPLGGATIENGCLHFVPGSHRRGVVSHRPLNGDPQIHGLEAVRTPACGAVACPVAPGGASVHHCRTLHYAGPNLTEAPRIAYTFVFARSPRQRRQPRSFPWLEVRRTAAQERRDSVRAKRRASDAGD